MSALHPVRQLHNLRRRTVAEGNARFDEAIARLERAGVGDRAVISTAEAAAHFALVGVTFAEAVESLRENLAALVAACLPAVDEAIAERRRRLDGWARTAAPEAPPPVYTDELLYGRRPASDPRKGA